MFSGSLEKHCSVCVCKIWLGRFDNCTPTLTECIFLIVYDMFPSNYSVFPQSSERSEGEESSNSNKHLRECCSNTEPKVLSVTELLRCVHIYLATQTHTQSPREREREKEIFFHQLLHYKNDKKYIINSQVCYKCNTK